MQKLSKKDKIIAVIISGLIAGLAACIWSYINSEYEELDQSEVTETIKTLK